MKSVNKPKKKLEIAVHNILRFNLTYQVLQERRAMQCLQGNDICANVFRLA